MFLIKEPMDRKGIDDAGDKEKVKVILKESGGLEPSVKVEELTLNRRDLYLPLKTDGK